MTKSQLAQILVALALYTAGVEGLAWLLTYILPFEQDTIAQDIQNVMTGVLLLLFIGMGINHAKEKALRDAKKDS